MKKISKIKQLFVLCLVFLLSINSFAAVVSDNDGSVFITKGEFDSLKNNFQSQIDSYNMSIDTKIDEAIASYLAGIKNESDSDLHSYLNNMKSGSVNGNDYKFIYVYPNYGCTLPTGCWIGVNAVSFGGLNVNSPNTYHGCSWIVGGNRGSKYSGGLVYEPGNAPTYASTNWNAYTNFKGFYLQKKIFQGTEYWVANEKKNHTIRYLLSYNGGSYHWNERWFDAAGASVDPVMVDWLPEYPDEASAVSTEFAGVDAEGYIKWVDCYDNRTIATVAFQDYVLDNVRYDSTQYVKKVRAEHKATYTVIGNSDALSFGCMTNSPDQTIYFIDEARLGDAVVWKDFTTGNKMVKDVEIIMENTAITGSAMNRRVQQGADYKHMFSHVYRHDIKSLDIRYLLNATATNLVGDKVGQVYIYNGEPICMADNTGKLHIKIKAIPTMLNGSALPSTWSGKLYISRTKFGWGTSASLCRKTGDSSDFTGYWTISNSQKNIDVTLDVNKNEIYWLKYVLDTNNSNLAVYFESEELKLHAEN